MRCYSVGDAGRAARKPGTPGFTGFLLALALVSALACGSPGSPDSEPSPSAPDSPRTVVEKIEACLDSEGNHPTLERYAHSLIEDSNIEIDRTFHGIGDPDGDGEVHLTMVFSHPQRRAMRILGTLHFETCEADIIYPPQQGTPHEQCQYLTEQGDYGPCALNAKGSCTCNPE